MPEGKEEIYSTMFKSLKHPIRRKILRILADKPVAFSDMLELLGISSSNLTYHLDNLGELVSKDEQGVYRLSSFGQASVNTMQVVEDAPTAVSQKKRTSLNRKWRIITSALLIAVIVFASVATLEITTLNAALSERDSYQSKYTQLLSWTSTTDNVIDFLQTVVQLDTSKYQSSLVSRSLDTKPELGGIPEETLFYTLTGTDSTGKTSKLSVQFIYRNSQFFKYQVITLDGSPIYTNPQSPFVLDAAKNIIDRMYAYEVNGTYLANMSRLVEMASLSPEKNLEIKEGNVKLNSTVSGQDGDVLLDYTDNGVDLSRKCVDVSLQNGVLTQLVNSWGLYSVGNTNLAISSERAITIAKDALNGFSWSSNGVVVNSFQYNTQPASVTFYPETKNDLTLYPQYTVVFYLDKIYAGGDYMISVTVWGDTGVAGTPQARNSPVTFDV